MPVAERKERLRALLSGAGSPLHFSDHQIGRGRTFYAARKRGDNQLYRFRVLEVRIHSPPAAVSHSSFINVQPNLNHINNPELPRQFRPLNISAGRAGNRAVVIASESFDSRRMSSARPTIE